MLIHFLEIYFEMIVGLYVWHNGEQIFIVFNYVFTHILKSHNMMIFYFHLPYLHVSNGALFFT